MRLESLVYQNNPFIIYIIGQSSIQHIYNTQSTEYYKKYFKIYIIFHQH